MLPIATPYGAVQIEVDQYRNGRRPAVRLVDAETGEPITVLSVNLPFAAITLADDEIFVKTWCENEPLVSPMLQSGLFEDTGRREPCGYAEAAIWRLSASLHKHFAALLARMH